MRVYVASSWRNPIQDVIVETLRAVGHEVYDFKNPKPGNTGFRWLDIDKGWKSWKANEFRKALSHPIATDGFAFDMDALKWCDVCVLVLPCGRSANSCVDYGCGWAARTRTNVFNGRPFVHKRS